MKQQLFLAFVFLIAVQLNSQQPHTLSTSLLTQLDSIALQDVLKDGPGIATGIVKEGNIIYEKYGGYADLKDSSVIGRDTRFNIASNGKQFTALAVLKLIEEKKLKASDDIRRFFPGLLRNIKSSITVEQLLNHSSGIRDVYDLWSLKGLTWWKYSFNNADAVALLFKQAELNFEPGTKHLYSNSNYILLAEIVAQVSGKSFKAYTDELFKKMKMVNTSFETDHSMIRGPVAKPYFNFDTWTNYDWIWNVYGDGNLFSTLADQLQWEQIVQTGKVSGISRSLIKKSQQLTANPRIDSYGYGLSFGEYKGEAYRYHEGATGAWKATTVRFRGSGLSIVTLTNTGKAVPSSQTRQMADVLLGLTSQQPAFLTKPAQPGDDVSIDSVTGIYQTASGFTFQFERRDTSLFLMRFGRNDTRLVRESGNIFYQWNDPAFKQEFKKNTKGEMEITAYYTTHAPYTLTRAENDWSGFNPAFLEGIFTNAETDVSFHLHHLSGNNYEITTGSKKSKAILVTPVKLLMNNYTIEWEKNSNQQVSEIFLTSDRIQRIRFSRSK